MYNRCTHSIKVRYGYCSMPCIHAMNQQIAFADTLVNIIIVSDKTNFRITFFNDFPFV